MTFPYYIHAFGRSWHPHPVFEVLAYTGGSQLYFFLRRRRRRFEPPLPIETNLWLLVGCIFGALVGAKLLALAENWRQVVEAAATDPLAWVAGKTIVGGLIGGWVGVEIVKQCLGVTRSTGDLFVFPSIVGIAVGRVGCFLTGLSDGTHGVPTTLPWGVDFGDGVRRHPTQLYEIAWLVALGLLLLGLQRRVRPAGPPQMPYTNQPSPQAKPGAIFRCFMLGYLGFRFAIEFLKPSAKPFLHLSAIQIACLTTCTVCFVQLLARDRRSSGGTSLEPV